MNREWISQVKQSGRFEFGWQHPIEVEVTTLDELIAIYGKPVFCKIDVEGLELDAVRGLSQAIPTLSFEFTPEYLDAAHACIAHLGLLGFTRFTYSLGESGRLAKRWWSIEDIDAQLEPFRHSQRIFGDVYASSE